MLKTKKITKTYTNTFFKKLYQCQKIENAISLSNIGLQVSSWAILSEIVYIYSIYCIVFKLNFSFFSADFGLRGH